MFSRSNISSDGTTFNVDDAYSKNDADDATELLQQGVFLQPTLTLDSVGLTSVQISSESFSDSDFNHNDGGYPRQQD